MKGHFLIEVIKDNSVVKSIDQDNLILQPGVQWYLKYASGGPGATTGIRPLGRIELGTGTTPPNLSQTQLINKNPSWFKEIYSLTDGVATGAFPGNIEVVHSNIFSFTVGEIIGTVNEIGIKITEANLTTIKNQYPDISALTLSSVPLLSRVVLSEPLVLQSDEQLRITYTVTLTIPSTGQNAVVNINGNNYQATIYKYSTQSYAFAALFPTCTGGVASTKILTMYRSVFTRNNVSSTTRANISRSFNTQTFVNNNTIRLDVSMPASYLFNGNIYGFSLRCGNESQIGNEFLIVNLNGDSFTKTTTEILNISLQWSVSAT
jgi:hypothetical protein